MRLLWTVANWKRTGPVEPSLDVAAALAAGGHGVRVAVGREPPGRTQGVAACVHARGLALVESGAHLRKHAAPLRNWLDARALRAFLRREPVDALVCTLRNDHQIAVAAAGEGAVIRLHFGDGSEALPRREQRALRASRGVVVFGRAMERRLLELGLPPQRIRRTGAPLDLAGLRARVSEPASTLRRRWGVADGALLVGIVARMQRHRRFELLWDAMSRLGDVALHLVVIGRGTHEEEVARQPVRERRLSSRVHFAGYLEGTHYASALAALDAQLLLVPGSDPTCRALREGQALGVPSLVLRRGLLPELVPETVGRVVEEESGAALADALRTLVALGPRRQAFAAAARQHASATYDPSLAAAAVLELLAVP